MKIICPQDKQEETARILAKGRKGESIKVDFNHTDVDPETETKLEFSAGSQYHPLNIGIYCYRYYYFSVGDFSDSEIIEWYWEECTAGQYTLFLQKKPLITFDNSLESKCQYTLIAPRLVILDSDETLILPDGAEQLTELELSCCESLNNIDALQNLTQLTELDLFRCLRLSNVDALRNLTSLTELRLFWCVSLPNVDGIHNLTNLTELELIRCVNLTNVDALQKLTKLKKINLHACESLTNVNALQNLTQLTELGLNDCRSLTNLDALRNLTNLTELDLQACESLTNVNALQKLTNLTRIDLRQCKSLSNLDGLQHLTNLRKLNLRGCTNLSKIFALSQLPHLTELDIDDCPNIADIETLRGHPALEELPWDSNPVLGGFELLSTLTNRNATEKIKEHSYIEEYSKIIPLMRSPEWQVPLLAKAFVLADELDAYEKSIALLREHHRLTLEQWQSYFEQAFLCGSTSFYENFLDRLCQSANDEDDEKEQKEGSSKNEINTLGGLLLALTSAPSPYRERALQIAENALQEETVQALREIAPAICLFYEKLGEHDKAKAWLKKIHG